MLDNLRTRLELKRDFGEEAVAEELTRLRPDDAKSWVMSAVRAAYPDLGLIRIICIHAASEADLIRDLRMFLEFMVKLNVGTGETGDATVFRALLDDPEFAKRTRLAQMTFWQTYDILNRVNYDLGHWKQLLEEVAAGTPDPR